MESAYVLARCLATHEDFQSAVVHCEAIGKEKAHHVTNTAWMFGRAAHMEDGLLRLMRDFTLKNTPKAYNDMQFSRLNALTY